MTDPRRTALADLERAYLTLLCLVLPDVAPRHFLPLTAHLLATDAFDAGTEPDEERPAKYAEAVYTVHRCREAYRRACAGPVPVPPVAEQEANLSELF